jgi:MOSC domain-containing protein YiiM
MPATLVQLSTSPGGIPKTPILCAHVTRDGVPGDRQRNRKYHGGPDRAICLFSVELYDRLRSFGIDLAPGAVGENFTTQGLDLQSLGKGDRLKVGSCTIEVTDVRVPCATLKKLDPDLPELIVGFSGWVCKVVEGGDVKPGDPVERVPHRTP